MNFKKHIPDTKDFVMLFLSIIPATIAILLAGKLSTSHPDYSIFIRIIGIEIPLYSIIVFLISLWLIRKIYLFLKIRNSELKILKATYGKDAKIIDITDYLNSRVKDNKLEVAVLNDILGGDPALGVLKEAIVEFEYKKKEYKEVFTEYKVIKLPLNQ